MASTLDRLVAIRTGRRVAVRLLQFVFLLYVIAYVDRIKVSFANLRMSADLGFNIATLYLVAAALVIGLPLQQPARAVAGIAQPD